MNSIRGTLQLAGSQRARDSVVDKKGVTVITLHLLKRPVTRLGSVRSEVVTTASRCPARYVLVLLSCVTSMAKFNGKNMPREKRKSR